MPDPNDILSGNSQDQSLAAASQMQSGQPGMQQKPEPGGFFKKLLANILGGTAQGLSAGIEAGPSAFAAEGFSNGFNQANADRQRFQQQQQQQSQQQFQNQLAAHKDQREQQAFQSGEQLKQIQMANSQLEMQRTSMMLNQMREDLRHPLQKASSDAVADFIKKGAGEIVAQGEDLPTAQQHIMELQKASPNDALHYFAAPSEVGEDGQPSSYAVVKMRPSGSMPSDGSYTIPGNKDLGIEDTKIDYKEGEDTRSLMSRYTKGMEDMTKRVSIAQHSKDTAAQIAGANWRAQLKAKTDELRLHSSQAQDKLGAQLLGTAERAYQSYANLGSKRQGWIFDKPETPGEKQLYKVAQDAEQKANEHLNSPAAKTGGTSMRVRQKSTGLTGTIDPKDFDPAKYDKVGQ